MIIRKATYNYDALRPCIFEIIDLLGGDRIKKNTHVLIKPNLLSPATSDKAIVTHPMVIRAVVEYVLQKGAYPQISDSPGIGSFEEVIEKSKIKDALRGLDVEYKEFQRSAIVDIGKPFGKIDIAEDTIKADIVINLPKLKTHAQMLLTLGVKNLFGCVVGIKKIEWHFRTGIDRDMFARLLIQIYKTINPQITIMDGILAMEGQGPGKRGTPRHLGILMGSSNGIALDITVCKILGINPDNLLTNKAAYDMGLVDEKLEINGEIPAIKDFKLPDIVPLVFGPKLTHGFMRRHFVQRPICDDSLCRMCGECWRHCPANAIIRSQKKLIFDYDKCIRCYCCIEMCPYGALYAKETLRGKIIRKVLKKN